MVKLLVTDKRGREVEVEARAGLSIMENIRSLPHSVEAVCGGMCACATCHVYVDPEWLAKTGEQNSMEQSMLDFANDVEDNSRLSCQIKVSEALDGLVVRLPKSQH